MQEIRSIPHEEASASLKKTSLDNACLVQEQLLQQLRKLPEPYQIPLQLSILEKWSNGDIAQYLGKPKGTIGSLLCRGKKLLQRCNEDKETEQFHPKRKVINLINRIGADPAAKIERLPRPYRDILRVYYIEGKTYTEIARLSGQPKNTIKSLVHRGREMLFEYWEVR